MGPCDRNGGLAGMGSFSANRLEHKWPAGSSLVVFVGIQQSCVKRPPVVDQGYQAADDSTTVQILGGEAAPTPLVLQLIEAVLAVATITVMLSNSQKFIRK